MAQKNILLPVLFLAVSYLSGTRSQYKFELSEIGVFYEAPPPYGVQYRGTRPCQICKLDDDKLGRVCEDAISACVHQFQCPVKYVQVQSLAKVEKVTLYTSRCVDADVEEAVRCPSDPAVYLVDGNEPNEIRLMISGGCAKPEQSRISGSRPSDAFEYVEYLKNRLKQERGGGHSTSRSGPSSSQPFDKSQKKKLKDHFKWFSEAKKRRKAAKKEKKQRQQGGKEEEKSSSESYEELFGEAAGAALASEIPMPELPEPDLSGVDLDNFFNKIGNAIRKFIDELDL